MERTDTMRCGFQSGHDALAKTLDGRVDLGLGDSQIGCFDVVEGSRKVAQGGIAAIADILDDPSYHLFGAEVVPESGADARPHDRWQRVGVDGKSTASDEQRLARRRHVCEASYHASRRHGAPEHN
jgi:hypothetical protein